MASKSFLYSKTFWRTNTDVQKRDEQTNRETKNSTFVAAPAAGEIPAPRNLACYPNFEHVLAPLKLLGSDALFRR